MRSYQNVKLTNGTAKATNAAADATVLAAPGAGKIIRLMKATISITVAAAGGGGEVALEDGVGGTRIFEADSDALGVYNLDFGDDGYPLTANTLLNLTVDGAVTTQSTARCTATGYIIG